jgi:hypothetical protein
VVTTIGPIEFVSYKLGLGTAQSFAYRLLVEMKDKGGTYSIDIF